MIDENEAGFFPNVNIRGNPCRPMLRYALLRTCRYRPDEGAQREQGEVIINDNIRGKHLIEDRHVLPFNHPKHFTLFTGVNKEKHDK
jgi:hypothetical protein